MKHTVISTYIPCFIQLPGGNIRPYSKVSAAVQIRIFGGGSLTGGFPGAFGGSSAGGPVGGGGGS